MAAAPDLNQYLPLFCLYNVTWDHAQANHLVEPLTVNRALQH